MVPLFFLSSFGVQAMIRKFVVDFVGLSVFVVALGGIFVFAEALGQAIH